MRRSILLALVTALALTGTLGVTASIAAGPGAEAQVAARATANDVTLRVGGGGTLADLSFPLPYSPSCPVGGIGVTVRGPLTVRGSTVSTSGTSESSIAVRWALNLTQPRLAYGIQVSYEWRVPGGSATCTGGGTIRGTLAKQ